MKCIDNVMMFLCTAVFAKSAAEKWQRHSQEANWEFQLSRRVIDERITKARLEADTLAGCSFSCSNLMNEEGLSLYFVQDTKTCYCNMAVDTSPENESVAELYYGTLRQLSKQDLTDEHFIRNIEWPYNSACLTLYQAGYKEDGVYRLDPIGGAPTDTWCDMTNGGWTVIQRRKDGSEDFYRGWSDYVTGFGNRTGEYWLGLENIHRLTQNGSHLEIFLEAFPGVNPASLTANYTLFEVDDSASNYTLHVAGFTGSSCGDSLYFHNGSQFTTYDNDNDASVDRNCAVVHRGAWWYADCQWSNLNGYYYQVPKNPYPTNTHGIHWYQCWSYVHSLKTSVMKIRSF